MAEQYDDLFLRDTLADTGTYPTDQAAGSPDIIPYQKSILEFSRAVSTYPEDIGMPLTSPGHNNLYLRVYNPGPNRSSGLVQLYWSAASLLLDPQTWRNQQVMTPEPSATATVRNASGGTEIPPQSVALAEPAFELSSVPPPGPNDHYCLIGVVQTPTNPVTLPTAAELPNTAAFVSWVENTPAVGWRNIAVVAATDPIAVFTLGFGNKDPVARKFNFTMDGEAVTVGSRVEVECTDPACPIQWNGAFEAPLPGGLQVLGFEQEVPGSFSGGLTVTLTPPPGGTFTKGMWVKISYTQIPSADPTPLELEVSRPRRLAAAAPGEKPVLREEGAIGVGTCTLLIEQKGDT